jgi:hypothetical protein
MTTAIIPIAKPGSVESDDAVADLLAERSRVIAELGRLRAIDSPVREAEARSPPSIAQFRRLTKPNGLARKTGLRAVSEIPRSRGTARRAA